MGNKLLTYKRMVNTIVIITETLICGGLFGLFYSWAQGSSWEKTMGVPQTQIMLTLMLCYFITAINTGVSLYNRKVYAYRIVGHVVQNMFVFAILAGCILTVGDTIRMPGRSCLRAIWQPCLSVWRHSV